MNLDDFITIDLPPLLAALFAALSCALLGNFLVLRRLSLMGDAISHAVLPGIVIAFFITSSREALPVFVGAAVAGVAAVVLIELVARVARLEVGAAMGVVFSSFFALGIVLIERASARGVDLDTECLLHGQLEGILWSSPQTPTQLWSWSTFLALPVEVHSSFLTCLIVLVVITLFYKELTLATFDPALASVLGFSSTRIHLLLMALVACAVVASFRTVGPILVIAMLVCPAATARLLTDRLRVQIVLSALIAVLAVVGGYLFGAFGPLTLGYELSLNSAGMMSVMAGGLFSLAFFFAPYHGIIARGVRQRGIAQRVLQEDILGVLLREEFAVQREGAHVAEEKVIRALGRHRTLRRALRELRLTGALDRTSEGLLSLTERGRGRAREIVRGHRLWETYLVSHAGLRSDHVHQAAEVLEHFTPEELRGQLAETQGGPRLDPHGREIP